MIFGWYRFSLLAEGPVVRLVICFFNLMENEMEGYSLYVGAMSAHDHEEGGVIVFDCIIKALSKANARDLCFSRMVKNFPTGGRYTHRVYNVTSLCELLTKIETE